MKITNVKVRQIDSSSKLKGVASVTLNDCFVVHEIRILEGDSGLFIAMPSKKVKEGVHKDTCHPINKDTRNIFEEAVIAEYKEVASA